MSILLLAELLKVIQPAILIIRNVEMYEGNPGLASQVIFTNIINVIDVAIMIIFGTLGSDQH